MYLYYGYKNNINVGMLRFEKSNESLKIQLQFRTKNYYMVGQKINLKLQKNISSF